jgi:hypothetical protein
MTTAPLDHLITLVTGEVDDLMTTLEAADLTAPAWRAQMAATLARGHLAAYMTGQGSDELAAADERRLLRTVTEQLTFLDAFTIDIQDAPTFQRGWNARAAMYAEACGQSYYSGKFKMWPLPALPRDGSTACVTRCSCSWSVEDLEGEGNANATWMLGPSDHCQQCVERAAQWAPLRIRNGALQ